MLLVMHPPIKPIKGTTENQEKSAVTKTAPNLGNIENPAFPFRDLLELTPEEESIFQKGLFFIVMEVPEIGPTALYVNNNNNMQSISNVMSKSSRHQK